MRFMRRGEGETWADYGRRRFTALAGVFWANGWTVAGSVLVLAALFLLVVFLGLHLYGALLARPAHPYVGLIGFMVLPGLLVLGWVLIGFGQLVRRLRSRRTGSAGPALEGERLLRRGATVGLITAVVLVVLGTFSYEAYHYTDSVGFCLEVCHQVMRPEGVAYARSPHANVACVDCHIGPGASWFVRSKLSGLRQVVAVLADSYSRPIPTPVENLRPARETCEVCHWPARFHGAKLTVRQHFEPDRPNTPTVTALVLKVGGLPRPGAPATGVHWHVDPRNEVRYRAADAERREILEVVQSTPEGEVRYLREGVDPDGDGGVWRVMDCIDCHNRPTHVFELPEQAVDEALADGRLDPALPYLRREAVRALRAVQPGDDTADSLASWLRATYEREHPEDLAALSGALPATTRELAAILERNVFPGMAITWGTYPINLTHFDAAGELSDGGCFRCHDEEHVSAGGQTISQDCDACHTVLAWREEEWAGLSGLGEEFLRRP
jgi:hypothetical protein